MSEKIDKTQPDGSTISATPIRQPHSTRWDIECSWCGPIGKDLGGVDSASLQRRHRHRDVLLRAEDYEYRDARVRKVQDALYEVVHLRTPMSKDELVSALEALGFSVADALVGKQSSYGFVGVTDEYGEYFDGTGKDLEEAVIVLLHKWLAKYSLEVLLDGRRLASCSTT